MVFSFLRRPQADLDLQIQGDTFVPGDVVNMRVTTSSREGFEVRSGRVTLTCIETHWRRQSDGKTTTLHKRTQKLVELQDEFMGGRRVHTGVPHREELSFVLPVDAPRTMVGKVANVIWELKASLDVPGARDLHIEKQLNVSPSRIEVESEPSPVVVEQSYEECRLRLELPSDNWRAGDSLSGRLRLDALKDVDFPEIRVELVCEEKAGDKKSKVVRDKTTLAQNASFASSRSQEWPFRLTIPSGFSPSGFISKTSVVWSMKVVLARNLRTDYSVERVIKVD